MDIKKSIRRLTRRLGIDIVRYEYQTSCVARLAELLKRHRINLIFDAGANTGQYGLLLRDLGYKDRIVSFEPVKSSFSILQKISRKDRLWQCENIALGERARKADINISLNSESSSLLEMLPLHQISAPESKYIGKQQVVVETGDAMMHKYCRNGDKVFFKIDAQGYERQILEGVKTSFESIVGFEIEMSFHPLYKGEITLHQAVKNFEKRGYFLMSLEPVFFSSRTGELMQVNGLFFKVSR